MNKESSASTGWALTFIPLLLASPDLSFGFEPVLLIASVLAAAHLIAFVGTFRNPVGVLRLLA
jgi:hypothetical protein